MLAGEKMPYKAPTKSMPAPVAPAEPATPAQTMAKPMPDMNNMPMK